MARLRSNYLCRRECDAAGRVARSAGTRTIVIIIARVLYVRLRGGVGVKKLRKTAAGGVESRRRRLRSDSNPCGRLQPSYLIYVGLIAPCDYGVAGDGPRKTRAPETTARTHATNDL